MAKKALLALAVISIAALIWPTTRLFATSSEAPVCNISWIDPAGGSWEDPTNWNTGSVPGPSSDVCIVLDGTYTVVLTASTTVRELIVGDAGSGPVLAIRSTGGNTVQLSVSEDLTNSGMVRLNSEGTAGAVTLAVAGKLITEQSGIVESSAGAGGTRTLVAEIDNRGSMIVGTATIISDQGAAHKNPGVFALTAGDLTVVQSGAGASFTNTGSLTITSGRMLTVIGGLMKQESGGVIDGGGTLNIQGATFNGVGQVAATVNNSGRIAPGSSAGTLSITGAYNQSAAGVLEIEIGGPGALYDRMQVTGNAALAGTLDIRLIGNFAPSPCDRFDVMSYGSGTGGFAVVLGTSTANGLLLRPDRNSTGFSITAYSPSTDVNIAPTTLNVTEGATGSAYRICLASQPTSQVQVNIAPNAQLTTSASSVSFPSANWNVTFDVIVTAVNDSVAEGLHTGVVNHTSVSTDPRFNGVTVASVTAQITDNDSQQGIPVASDSTVTTSEDTALQVTMIAVDSNTPTLVYTVTNSPAHGSLSAVNGNKVTYTPGANFYGTDSFKFRASDGTSNSNIAIVTITVISVNDQPVGNNNSAATQANTAVNISVLGNDTDNDGDALSVGGITSPAHGTVQLLSGGVIRYTPNTNFTGTDQFSYTVIDGKGGAGTAQVIVSVGASSQNAVPVARDDSVSTQRGTVIDVAVLANDSDADGDSLAVTGVSAPANGTAVVMGARVRYTPNASFTGTDRFSYTVIDGNGGNATAQVKVKISIGNNAGRTRIDFSGVVQSMPGDGGQGTWQIHGLTVVADGSARVKNSPVMGGTVSVKGWLSPDGVVYASEIKGSGRDNGNGNGRGNDNSSDRDDDDDENGRGKNSGKGDDD